MQLTLSARSALASVGLVGLGMLASPGTWRASPHSDSRNLEARLVALESAALAPQDPILSTHKLMQMLKFLPHMRIVHLDNGNGTTSKTIQFHGVNVQIVNGLGATNGNPADPLTNLPGQTTVNGMGNLIVGYSEAPTAPFDRTGSHNIVVGIRHQWSSFGGLLGGWLNTISGAYSSVSGGSNGTASGDLSSVPGGSTNFALGAGSSVSGGFRNFASGTRSSVSGGDANNAGGRDASISGGQLNQATADKSSITGGIANQTSGRLSSITAGRLNTASGGWSSVSGGRNNLASGQWSSVSGGAVNHANGGASSVSGGQDNVVAAAAARGTVSGGCEVTVSEPCGHQ
jgi:hypothetical protein